MTVIHNRSIYRDLDYDADVISLENCRKKIEARRPKGFRLPEACLMPFFFIRRLQGQHEIKEE